MMRAAFGGAVVCAAAASWSGPSRAQAASPAASSAAPSPAAPTSVQPPATPPATPTSSTSFVQPETGVPVEFDADRPHVSVFVAQGAVVDVGPAYPDPFVKLGRTPFSVKLAPGVYTLSVESPDIATQSQVFEVGSQPVHVRVKSGSAGARGLGSLLLAIGAAGVLAGLVIEVSYTSAPNGISKSKIAVPMFVVGGVGLLTGLTVYLTAGTTIEQDGPKPDRRGGFIGVTSRW